VAAAAVFAAALVAHRRRPAATPKFVDDAPSARVHSLAPEDAQMAYDGATLECDLVLEGGVTSAVIHAGLLVELAKTHRLRSIGGTSSGAVAATAAAVAEALRTHKSSGQGFVALGTFIEQLAQEDLWGRTQLLRLFQPGRGLKPTFGALLAVMQLPWHQGVARVLPRAVLVLLRCFALWALVPTLLPWAAWFGATPPGTSAGWLAALSTLLASLVLALVGLASGLAWAILLRVPRNLLGLCSGHSARENALCDHLHKLYNGQFARRPDEAPVCFGDLWYATPNAPPPDGKRAINLQVLTTALQLRRPMRLPGDPGTEPLAGFYYDPTAWAKLFPARVMQALDLAADGAPMVKTPDGRVLRPIPPMARFPVVIAARLSLSFPLLLSPVPMYQLRRRPGAHGRGDDELVAHAIDFSDGGITSNCPVDMFDRPLPSRPTFTVNLFELPRGQQVAVRFPENAAGPEDEPVVKAEPGAAEVPALLTSVVMTALNWRDNLQRALPGYRERVLHVGLPPELGGLNLNMAPKQIAALAAAGVQGAKTLANYQVLDGTDDGHGDQALPAAPSRWERHRWQRLRIALAALKVFARDVKRGSETGTPDYLGLLSARPSPMPPLSGSAAAQEGRRLLQSMRELGDGGPVSPIEENAPQPRSLLHPRAPY
jgi:predicted acylesterase/phospholipase RssA